MFDLSCIIYSRHKFFGSDIHFFQIDTLKNTRALVRFFALDTFAKVTSFTTVKPNSDWNFHDEPSCIESVVKFLMEFVQELRKGNTQLNKQLEKAEEKDGRLTLGQSQNSKVIFFIFIYFILNRIDSVLFFSVWS